LNRFEAFGEGDFAALSLVLLLDRLADRRGQACAFELGKTADGLIRGRISDVKGHSTRSI